MLTETSMTKRRDKGKDSPFDEDVIGKDVALWLMELELVVPTA